LKKGFVLGGMEGLLMITLTVNGKKYTLDVPRDIPLLWVLRDHLGLTGTKYACGIGECGSCTVHLDGKAERSCTISAEEAEGREITTIEGLPENHPVKRAWIKEQVVQCGYCQPGVIMQVAALLAEDQNPDADQVIDSMDDVICRCGTYQRMKKGINTAVKIMNEER
jgi:isoquinoline 1-oxidoreductase alpha subunit